MTDTQQRSGRTYQLQEVRIIKRPLAEVFEYAADFSNSAEWDPGVDSSEKVDPGPVEIGSKYRLIGNFGPSTIPMDYEVLEYDPPNRVVLFGQGSAFDSRDTMVFEPAGETSTRISYTADITLYNFLRYLGPAMNWPLKRMGEHALDGLAETLGR